MFLMLWLGPSKNTLSIPFKLHLGGGGGVAWDNLSQMTDRRLHGVSSTVDMKISQVVEKYHNPDPLLKTRRTG